MSFVDNMLGETLHTDGELDEAAKLGQSENFERVALVLVKKVELGGGRPWTRQSRCRIVGEVQGREVALTAMSKKGRG